MVLEKKMKSEVNQLLPYRGTLRFEHNTNQENKVIKIQNFL